MLYSSKIIGKFVWKLDLCALDKDLDIINACFASESSGKSFRQTKYFKVTVHLERCFQFSVCNSVNMHQTPTKPIYQWKAYEII